ncbi:MAG: Ig-like domain repeat protein, partial [Betaproteobacteria bacterium]|nr:Ig-like domain repeat protein [Betaproteobacteria bacterium]
MIGVVLLLTSLVSPLAHGQVTSLAQGSSAYHALAVNADGTLLAWGWNANGQLGDGTTTNRSKAVRVDGISGVIAAVASETGSVALKSDGTVWAWGDLTNDNAVRPVPLQVVNLAGMTAVAAGRFHALALGSDGTVWAWGYNGNGQLGDSTTTSRGVPVQVSGLSGVTAIAAGESSSYALMTDGTVWAWGYNGTGQLGDGSTTQSPVPVQVKDAAGTGFLTGVGAITAGRYHAAARLTGGTVWAWGYNGSGQLGDNTTTDSVLPVQVKDAAGTGVLSGVSAIAATGHAMRARLSDGTVVAWGYNGYGQLGDGTNTSRSLPVSVIGGANITAIAGGSDHTFMLRNDGAVLAAGYNVDGQLGNGTTVAASTPVQVYLGSSQIALGSSSNPANPGAMLTLTATLTGSSPTGTVTFKDGATTLAVAAVSAGVASYTTNTLTEGVHRITAEYSGDGANNPESSGTLIQTVGAFGLALKVATGSSAAHALAMKSDGTLLAWGANGYGQLGDGTTTSRSKAVRVDGISNVIAAAASESASIAIVGGATPAQNTVWAWGDLINDNAVRPVPAQVANLTGVTAVAAGRFHALALKSDGTVWAWGQNNNGELGDTTTTGRALPVQVSGLSGVVAVAAGEDSSYALKGDGTVWAWGYNGSGRLGDGSTAQSLVPVQVSGLTNVSAIAAGQTHAVALKTDGTVWAWGYGYYGPLGDGTSDDRLTPVQSAITGVIAIAAGYLTTRALKPDGTVWAWGYNGYGQLGDGSTSNRYLPVVVTGVSGIMAIADGVGFAFLTRVDGAIYALGYNANGALGNGTTTAASTPVQVYLGASSMVLASSSNPATTGADVTLTATLTGTSPTGTVTFRDGSTTLATVPVTTGTASYTTNTLTEGVHRITAEYSGDGSNNPEGSGVLVQTVGAFGLALKVAAGPAANHALAVKSDGTLLAWGYNSNGQLGDGTTTSRSKAVRVDGISGVIAAAASESASIAIVGGATVAQNTVWAWGDLVNDGSVRPVPAQVANLTGVTAVAAGRFHALALKSDGTVWAWGQNGNGRLGDGSTTNRAVPVQVGGLSGVVAIAAGEDSSYALMADGTVWAWGYNGYGQLGDNTVTQRLLPVQVKDTAGTGFLTGVSAIAAGRLHAAALKTDGTVWVWGYNGYGQVGDGNTNDRSTPSQSAIAGVMAISAGNDSTRALKSDGTVWAWGYNGYGQLGDGTATSRSWPVVVTGLGGIAAIAEGENFAFLMRADGAIYALGYNGNGALGNGTTNTSSNPLAVQVYLGSSSMLLASSVNPATTGANVTLTATLTGTSPTGTVTFRDGSTTLATVPVTTGTASYTTNTLTEGVHR